MSQQSFFGNSFFDAEYPQPTFDFITPTTTHARDLNIPPVVIETMTCLNRYSLKSFTATFGLQGNLLVRYENGNPRKPVNVLEVLYSRISCEKTSVLLAKNRELFELKFQYQAQRDKWFGALKNVCVLTNIENHYLKLKMIGKGSSSEVCVDEVVSQIDKVYLVQSKKTKEFFAAKVYAKNNFSFDKLTRFKTSLLNQINFMRILNHQDIIRVHEVFEAEDTFTVIMNYFQGASLQDLLSRPTFRTDFADDQVMYIFRQILGCAAFLSSKGIMHRDLKPANFLMNKEGQIKLMDLGLAAYTDMLYVAFKKCGSPGYIAPEVFNYREGLSSTNYNSICDSFSAGCILFYMFFGRPLFEGKTGLEVLSQNRDLDDLGFPLKIIQSEIKDPKSQINKSALNLLLQLLEPNPNKRTPALIALKHDYFAPLKTKVIKFDISKDLLLSSFSDYTTSLAETAKTKSSVLVDKSKKGIAIYVLDDIPDQPKDKYTKMESLYLNLNKPEIPRNIDTRASISATVLNDKTNSYGSMRGSFLSNGDSNGSSCAKFGTLPNVYKSLRTSLFKNRKQSEGFENAENIEMRPISEDLESPFEPENIQKSARSHSSCTNIQSFGVMRLKSSFFESEEEEDLDEIPCDEDEKSNMGFYMSKIKELEIVKPDAKMARFL